LERGLRSATHPPSQFRYLEHPVAVKGKLVQTLFVRQALWDFADNTCSLFLTSAFLGLRQSGKLGDWKVCGYC
jgi:hypothetical protein